MQKTVINKKDPEEILQRTIKLLGYKRLLHFKKLIDRRLIEVKQHRATMKKLNHNVKQSKGKTKGNNNG